VVTRGRPKGSPWKISLRKEGEEVKSLIVEAGFSLVSPTRKTGLSSSDEQDPGRVRRLCF
jgi:hypothetical protein